MFLFVAYLEPLPERYGADGDGDPEGQGHVGAFGDHLYLIRGKTKKNPLFFKKGLCWHLFFHLQPVFDVDVAAVLEL